MADNTAPIINDDLSLIVPEPGDTSRFTGERFIPSLGGEIEIEHFHRYFYAAFFCKGKTVLDIACGEGYGSFILSQRALSVTGVDIAADVIEEAKKRYGGGNRRFKAGECTAIPCEDSSFDVVVSFETVEHITEQAAFLKEIRRVLKPAGVLVISSPDREEYGETREKSNPFHQKELSLEEFRKLLTSNFAYTELLGQTNAFGSFIMPEARASVFHEFHQEKGLVTTNKMTKATYLIAVCSERTVEMLPTTFYGVPDSAYMMSGLQGGIKERDQEIIKLRSEVSDEKNSVAHLQEAQLTLLAAYEADKKDMLHSFEQKFLESIEHEHARFSELHDECTKRGLAIQQSGTDAHNERAQRIAAHSLANGYAKRLHNVSRMNELESTFLEGDGWILRYSVTLFTPRVKFAQFFNSDEEANHRRLLQLSGLFDPQFYGSQNNGGTLADYLRKGWKNQRQPHPLFDPVYFRAHSPEPKGERREPILAFLLQEKGQHSSPHMLFDIQFYSSQIPNNAFAARFPLTHFLLIGGFSGLDPHPLFDSDFYLSQYPDVASSGVNPLVHYVMYGASEDRIPHPCFDPLYYKSQIAETVENPLLHFLETNGRTEPNKYFSSSYYVNKYKDVAEASLNPFIHFVRYGEKEGREPCQYFSVSYYSAANADVGLSGESALGHFTLYGEQEGRIPYPHFDAPFYRKWHAENKAAQRLPFAHFFYLYGSVSSAMEPFTLEETANALSEQTQIVATDALVSIVIPVYGNLPYTLRCLRSLGRHVTKYSFEIIVVDDCSPDGTGETLVNLQNIRLVRKKENQGFISACNSGAEAAKGKYLLFLNNDTEVLADWLDELVLTFERETNVGLVGSKLIYPTGELQEAGGIIWADGSAWNYGRNGDREHPDYNFLRAADYISGASVLISKKLFDDLGGFDREYSPAYAEDCDLAFKVRNSGLRVLYQPNSEVVHCEGISSGKSVKESIKAYQVINLEKLNRVWKKQISSHGENFSRPDIEADREAEGKAIFFDATTPTIDQDGGSLIAYYWMLALKKLGYGVTFVPQDNLAYHSYYSKILQGQGIRCVHRPYYNSVEEIIKAQPGELRLAVIFRYMVGEAVIDLLRKYQPQAKIILHNVDLHYLRMHRQAVLEKDPFKARLADRVKLRELKIHGSVDLVHTLSDFEKNEITQLLPDTWVEVSQPIQDCWRSGQGFADRKNICFIGGFRHQPNIDAVQFFVKEVMLLLRNFSLGIKFLIVGAEAPESILALRADDVIVVGHVKELRDVFKSVKLSVAPIRFGAGVKTKVSASMGYGVPVVATSVAVEGMGLTNGIQVLTGNTPAELAAAVARLYTDQAVWESVANKAFEYASSRFSFDSFTQNLKTQLIQLNTDDGIR